MVKRLILCRGLPGTGKSTLANMLTDCVFEADDYFVGHDGEYRFDPSFLAAAHKECLDGATKAMWDGIPVIAVANTFSRRWEAAAYFEAAEKLGYSVSVIETQMMFGNKHGVPSETIRKMRERWEDIC